MEDKENDFENFEQKIKLKKSIFKIRSKVDKRNKNVKYAKRGWSDKLNAIIWEKFRLPCAWKFIRSRVRVLDIAVVAECKECDAQVDAVYEFASSTLHINIQRYRKIPHTKKRYISRGVRKKYCKMLENSSAYAVKSRIANQLMKAGDFVPAHLPTANGLRKMKCSDQESDGSDPIDGLRNMKLGRYRDDIQNIGLDPFFVYYSTSLQREWYNTEFKRRHANISIDAPGLGLSRLNTTLSQGLLLYVITAFGRFIYKF